jgi:hypothetical protein
LWRSLQGTGLSAALLAAAASAHAQVQAPPPLALDRFDPAPAGDRLFGVQSPFVAGHLTPHVMILADYAHDPLVLRLVPANTKIGNVVTNQLFLHVNAGLALWNRLSLNVDAPVAVFQNGDNPVDPSGAGQTFPSPSKAQFGDLRIGLRVRLFGEYHDPFQGSSGSTTTPSRSGSAGTSGHRRRRGTRARARTCPRAWCAGCRSSSWAGGAASAWSGLSRGALG